jgi:3-dehydroquinate synthase
MNKITVRASRTYDVLIGQGNLSRIGALMPRKPSKVALIAEERVAGLYAGIVRAGLEAAGIAVELMTFPGGEDAKSPRTLFEILEFLAGRAISRGDMLLALGGGVTGDLTGFAAAVYLRGIEFVQVPTTLLAMVDASVGGKTAVNLAAGKNLAGAFHQPSAVVIDPDVLGTLPPQVLADGVSEAIKTGAIADRGLFDQLMAGYRPADAGRVIARCIQIKRDLVESDERDTGLRQLLNFGHTIGHAVEHASGYTISHGHAVAIGMLAEARAARAIGFSREDCAAPMRRALENNHLPTHCPFSADALLEAALRDKKVRQGQIALALPVTIGRCELHPVKTDALGEFIARALDTR